MCFKCLQTHYMLKAHNLHDALTSSLDQWNLDPEKQVVVTTDSGANIKLACELLGWQRLSCFGHNLDLAVHKGLDDLLFIIYCVETYKEYSTQIANYTRISQYIGGIKINLF